MSIKVGHEVFLSLTLSNSIWDFKTLWYTWPTQSKMALRDDLSVVKLMKDE